MKLIVIDMQKGIVEDDELFRRESLLENAAKIIAAAANRPSNTILFFIVSAPFH